MGVALVVLWLVRPVAVRGEAMLQLFNVSWADVIVKMPEIAEAGYDSIWLPPPAKGSSVFSIGYDLFDPFDLGDVNQAGTTATHWGTKLQLQQMVETAHRFGLRVYFDNIMNHRGFTVPGFNSGTPTNHYPGLLPQDFHLQKSGNYFVNWPSVQDYNNQWDVQYQSLGGLIDLATEPGSVNGNFGTTSGSTTAKPVFLRQPGKNSYYMVTNLPAIQGSPWRPFNGTNGVPVAEDVNAYLIRSVLYTMNETKCDGFRLDAVKHVPSGFFGDTAATFNGYCGAIQAMFDYVHGYGTNVLGNGYSEPDDSRNSCFDTEVPRNDALLFGEHLGQPPSYSEYISRGMRLVNSPLRDTLNSALGGGSLSGLDQRDIGAIIPIQSVMFAQSHDASGCCATHRDLQNAYYFMHEGIANIYSDNYNQSGPPNYFPTPPYANYLGQFSDNQMPDIAYLHKQLARGGTAPRWSEQNLVAYERYDYREGGAIQDQTTVLFVMNDKYSFPGDITFDDGVGQTFDGYYGGISISNSKNVGLAVGFPPGSVLVQLASSSPTVGRAYNKLLVHSATGSLSAAQAQSSLTNANPTQRLIHVGGQTIPSGGGAVELNVPSGSWVMYGYQWPEASRANPATNAIVLRQGGAEAPRIRVYRTDGANGDAAFNPVYPFKMRGSVDQFGNVVAGVNISNKTYAIDIPVITNANFDILVRNDASSSNTQVKLDGGTDLNSQMGLGPVSGTDWRDNKPGTATDVFLGYEQTALQFRNGPEKFAARNILSNNIVSLGAETYYYTVGGASNVIAGAGYGAGITNQTAAWVQHDPLATNSAAPPNNTATQRVPLSPAAGQATAIYVKVGYQFQINTCFIYYTTDGTNPEGAFGTGKGTTQVIQAGWVAADSAAGNIDWWKGIIPAQLNGVQVRYKVALFSGGSVYAGQNIAPISDAESSGSKYYGLNQAAITNFNPVTARVWLHNDLNTNSTATGLSEGYHILRARTFLPRAGKSSVFNTFSQTFYYDAGPPSGVVAFPTPDGSSISSSTYSVVVRGDSSVTSAEFNIQDSNSLNDDAQTGQANGNGNTNGLPRFVAATAVTPSDSISATYPNLPNEFRFNYVNVPGSGTATINVRLRKSTSSLLTNRVTTVSRMVNTLAPQSVLFINAPATEGMILTLNTNDIYVFRNCYSTNLPATSSFYSLYLNGVLQPRASYVFLDSGCGSGLKSVNYVWNATLPGTNTVSITYSNLAVQLQDTRSFVVARPGDSDGDGVSDYNEILAGTNPFDPSSVLRITQLLNESQLVWDSVAGRNYQVLATTNLLLPFTAISSPIQAGGASAFFVDSAPDATNKFYRIQLVP